MLEINRKEIPIGSIVYFISVNKQGYKIIKYGTVEEHYTSEICVQLYDFCERRIINGIPVEDIQTPTKWKKLPQGWNYGTRLFELDYRPLPENTKNLKPNNPNDILKAIEEGILVKVQTIDYGRIEATIDKEKGWRLERKYDGEYHPFYVSLNFHKVYKTYEEAQAVLDAEIAEFKRQSELSDYDWAVEQIDKELKRWAYMYSISEEEKQRYRDRILSLNKVEDIEIRIFHGSIQWKYWGKKRWMNIEV